MLALLSCALIMLLVGLAIAALQNEAARLQYRGLRVCLPFSMSCKSACIMPMLLCSDDARVINGAENTCEYGGGALTLLVDSH